jgi:diadenosine tetraphosphate (Ap4A) HIT family hydrolase
MDRFSLARWRRDVILLVLGIVLGGYLFADTQPRSFLAIGRCQGSCGNPQDLLGLVGSVLMQRAPGVLPLVVAETDRTIAIAVPGASVHYVVIPKRDIRDAGDLAAGDEAYLVDAYAVIGRLVRERGLKDYAVLTNGPARQDVNYLHFHVLSKEKGDSLAEALQSSTPR